MPPYYFDSSALVKRFAREQGSAFVLSSSDGELNDAAKAEGFSVEDPNNHP